MGANSKPSHAELLQSIKDNYASELSGKIDDIELHMLALDKPDNFSEALRLVHSMKGSAGTHGFTILSSVCHHLEDCLAQVDANNISNDDIDRLLQYVDLLKQINHAISENNIDNRPFEQALEHLARSGKQRLNVILVDNSKSIHVLLRKQLDGDNLHFTAMEDGYQALNLLLTKKYPLIICSEEIGPLNGRALIAALRHSNSANRGSTVIYLSSNPGALASETKAMADYVLMKDASITEAIRSIVHELQE